MSRRAPNPAADRAAQNQQALKTLVKLESNKSCADCKKNKHPRWASWNLGIFVCIRCSGIHRGMGTHISRVKSVDLDSWTDEQLQSMLKWGNARANKYWEAKLAPGHVPAEAKIENFIRTKYDTKRWVMDGGIPDPATLDEDAEDDVPLNLVKEKTQLAQPQNSGRQPLSSKPLPNPASQAPKSDIDLFGDATMSAPPVRPSSAAPSIQQRVEAPVARAAKPTESLLGLDFFGGTQANPPARPSGAVAAPSNGPSRPDLKQSILSLYSRPSSVAPPQSQPTVTPQTQFSPPNPTYGNTSSLDDAFSSLNFSGPVKETNSTLSKPNANASQPPRQPFSPPSLPSIAPGKKAGHFFDANPPVTSRGSSGGFGDFAASLSPATTAPPQISKGNGLDDLLGFGAPPAQTSYRSPQTNVMQGMDSPFNLSSSSKAPQAQSAAHTSTLGSGHASGTAAAAAMSANPWDTNDAWTSAPSPAKPAVSQNATSKPNSDWEWSGQSITAPSASKVAADEDFGGWESSTVASPVVPTGQAKRPTALGGSEDLFSNVWE